MSDEELLAKYKAVFPDNVEAIVVRKDDYDRLYGDLTIENIELKQKIKRLNNIINELEKFLNGDDWTSVNGVIAVHLIKYKLQELKGSDNNVK